MAIPWFYNIIHQILFAYYAVYCMSSGIGTRHTGFAIAEGGGGGGSGFFSLKE